MDRPTFLEQWAELGRAVGEVRDAVLADWPVLVVTWLAISIVCLTWGVFRG